MLTISPMEGSARSIERKVITALFCDVVGSTELGERLDPEDTDRLLTSYHRLARRRIEANGGTLEKFIGDAVVGVFGAPSVHEDDPARAIRAALAIVRDVEASGLGLQVRIGIDTGESVVRVDEWRSAEEGLAVGDILNTAARLQSVAPTDGVVVGESTQRRTLHEFEWHDLGEVTLKGKMAPVHVWQPFLQAHSDQPGQEATPFLGRQAELATLSSVFDRAVGGSQIELVTILADAGMGKSRLVREFRRVVRETPNVTWRSGRCLPYGDGVSFWALGEIVKSHAGILETDDQPTLSAKLNAAVSEPDPQVRTWLVERLAPLAGLQTDAAAPEQAELFAAWTRFFISLAASHPAVLVLEDLHWADAALVEFLMHLADSTENVPLTLVTTARPEVAERHAAWLERAARSTVIQLVSLSDDEIRALVESTFAGASGVFIATVLERAAGSPLYAEQLVALARERGLSGADAVLDESTIPPTIQALLAARVDALPKELKPVLLDASVIGRVFWSGAVANLEGRERADAEPDINDLANRQLARSQKPSTMAEEQEYGFWHALLRDVAYSFLPRAARLAKHRAAAAWITERAGERLGDLAEIVADHLHRAEELATATDAVDDLPAIRSDLASALIAAADHTMRVQPARAIGQLRDAVALLGADDARLPTALTTLGAAYLARAEHDHAAESLAAAAQWLLDRGHDLEAAELATQRSRALDSAGRQAEALVVLDQARPILEANPGPGLVEFLAEAAVQLSRQHSDQSPVAAETALRTAAELGLPKPYRALIARAWVSRDVQSGLADLAEAFDLAMAAGDRRSAFIALSYQSEIVEAQSMSAALSAFDPAIEFARRYGLEDAPIRASRLGPLEALGMWDELLEECDELYPAALERGDEFTAFLIRTYMSEVQFERGIAMEPLGDLGTQAESVGLAPTVGAPLVALVALTNGDPAGARAIVERAVASVREGQWITSVEDYVVLAIKLGDLDLARAILAKAYRADSQTERGLRTRLATALLLEAEGQLSTALTLFDEAVAFFNDRGDVFMTLISIAGAGRSRIGLGDVDRGIEVLGEAREIAVYLKASRRLRDIDLAIEAAEATRNAN